MAPTVFNKILDIVAHQFEVICDQNDCGIRSDDRRVSLIRFADCYFLISNDAAKLSEMLQVWINLLRSAGWTVPLGEISWCHSQTCIPMGFVALGAIVQF